MNRLQIETESRILMAEKTAASSYATASDVQTWINDGIKDMCEKGKVFPKTIPLTVTNNVKAYNLPWEFLEPIKIENHKGVPLDLITLDTVGRVFTLAGKPLYFYFTVTPITLSAWTVSTTYLLWPITGTHTLTYIVPTVANGYLYECIIAGTSHTATEPTWVTTLAGTNTDGTVTWKCRNLIGSLQTINFHDTPTTVGGGIGNYSLTYSAMDCELYADTSSPNLPSNLHRYLVPFVCYRWSIKNRDAQLAAAFYQEYSAGIGLPPAPTSGGGQGAS